MTSRDTLAGLFSIINDEDLEVVLADSNDLIARMAALREIGRNATSESDIEPYLDDVESIVENFFEELLECLVIPEDQGREIIRRTFIEFGRSQGWVKESTGGRLARWRWPIIQETGGRHGMESGVFRPHSALKIFGYTVGQKGWPKVKRQNFLSDFIEKELPEIVEREFPGEYGAPNSTTRLKKVADVIASNCSLRIRNDRKKFRVAIQDWMDDLEFLKRKYYVGRNMRFHPWPEPGE